MKTYKILKPVTLHAGIVRLTKKQAFGRDHKLRPIWKQRPLEGMEDCYEITSPNQFIGGEVFGYDGEIPSISAEVLNEPEAEVPGPTVFAEEDIPESEEERADLFVQEQAQEPEAAEEPAPELPTQRQGRHGRRNR